MNREQAVTLVQETFQDTFDKQRFTYFLKNLLNDYDESKAFEITSKTYIKEMYREYIASYQRLGTYTDSEDHAIDLLIVHLRKETSLERARTTQRNFVATYLKDRGEKDAALVAFVSPNLADWRFSLITMEYRFEKGRQGRMKVKEEFTPARRWSFLVGTNENSHTAQSRLAPIIQEDRHSPTLAELGEAFNIEKVTKEFFEKYRDLFFRVKEELDALCKQQASIRQEFEQKQISTVDFVKKLLGQIVFLYFLQKKGWFGVHRDKQWGRGSRHFLRELFKGNHAGYHNFFNDLLEPLFYEALRLDRSHADDYYSKLNCRIPFLNGGLFDPINGYDWVHTDIMLPDDVFSNTLKTREGDRGNGILDIFDRYNFTVKEDEPLEKEVAVDPEMLGKVFENLLEVKDRKSKGTYYTPREIVHYMCQQSLIQYLDTTLNNTLSSFQEFGSEQTNFLSNTTRSKGQLNLEVEQNNIAVPRENLETLFRVGESVSENEARVVNFGRETDTYSYKLPESIRTYAQSIDDKLANIKVCDPAIGSGAFPVGMMSEIVRVRQTLSSYINAPDRTPYHFKRDCIQHALYGVDIDPGAVEIAKLRLWLSLVVDEEDMSQIKPLPNLDYKILCGNSLLSVEKNLFNNKQFKELERLKPLLFDETSPRKKAEYKQKIDRLIEQITNGHTEFDFEVYFSEVFHEKDGFDVVIGNPPYVSLSKLKSQTHILKKQGFATYSKTSDIYCLFYEKGIQILKKQGVLCYITSNSWMRTKYGQLLRKYFAEKTNPLVLINFEDTRIFDEAIVESNILLIQKAPFQNTLKAGAFTSDFDKNTPIAEYFTQKHILLNTLDNQGWNVSTPQVLALKQKIEKDTEFLKYFGISINYGIKTGFNKAFIIDNEIKDELIRQEAISAEIIKPVLRGRDIGGFYYKWAGLWLVNSHNGLKNKNMRPIDVRQNYPVIYKHLLKYEHQLKKRTDKGDDWTNLRDCAYLEEFEEPKIIWGELSNEPKFAYDEDSHFLNNTVFMMTGKNLKYLLAILNSRLSKWYFEQISTTSGMGTNRWLKYKIEQIPIKHLSPAEQRPFEILVDYVIFLKKIEDILPPGKDQIMSAFFEQVIDGGVYELYFGESLKDSRKDILQFLHDLPEIGILASDEERLITIKSVFNRFYQPTDSVGQRLYYMDSVREIRIIKGLEVYD